MQHNKVLTKKRLAVLVPALLLLLALGWVLLRRHGASTPVTKQDFAMDTLVTQTLYGGDGQSGAALLRKLDAALSMYQEGSDVSRLTKAAGSGSPVSVEEDTLALLLQSQKYSRDSGGLFDITLAPITSLWGVTSETPKVPAQAEIDAALSLVGIDGLTVDAASHTAMLDKAGMGIDLGGIAKGYACDKLMELYRQEGKVTSALTSFGSSLLFYGTKPDAKPYTVGIRNPFAGEADYMGTLTVGEGFLSTSGGYERYFEAQDKQYIHIFDPRTGRPSESDLVSVTVVSSIAGGGAYTDYLSTLLFVGGKGMLQAHLNEQDYSVVAIDRDAKVYISPALENSFTIVNDKFVRAAQ